MRSEMFRTALLDVGTANVVIFTKDFDGVAPLTVYLENFDQPASVIVGDAWASMQSKIKFTSVAKGVVSTTRVTLTEAVKQAFSIVTASNDVTINLECGADGVPTMPAAEVCKRLNADVNASAVMTAAPVHSGYAPARAHAQIALAGAFVSTVTGAATVEEAERLDSDDWVANAAAGTALSTIAAKTHKAYQFANGAKCVRVKVTKGAAATKLVGSAVKGRTSGL